MATSLSELKKKKGKRLEDLKSKLENNNNSNNNKDERFWYPAVDQAGNGFAIIRFLDSPKGEDNPYIKMFSHAFQGPNGWYIENCPTTLGKDCPLCDFNRRLWNSGIESDKDIVRGQKRKLSYISNVLVIKDPSNPENEGQVRLFRYGQKIFEKLQDQMKPEFEDETPVNIFDFWDGANFRLKIRQVAGYRNYDKSEFDSPSELMDGDDEKIEKLWLAEHSLNEFVDPANYKPAEELHARLVRVLGFDPADETLHRPGDVVASPKTHETAEKKLSEKLTGHDVDEDEVEEEEEVPEDFKKDKKKASDEDDDDFFSDIASKL